MIFNKISEFRAESVNPLHPKDPGLVDMFGFGSTTSSGVRITSQNAIQINAVYAAVRLISETIATLPLNIMEKSIDENGRSISKRAFNHLHYEKLHYQPNPWQTSVEWREMMLGHAALRGAGYSKIERNGDLIPLNPDGVFPVRAKNGIAYHYVDQEGDSQIYLQSEMHVIKGFSLNDVMPQSPVETCRESLGLAKAAEEFGARFFGNGTVIGGYLQHPGQLSEPAQERLVKAFEKRHQGSAAAHKPAVLEEGMKWQALGIEPDKAQFLETRKFQIAEIARIFRVPPHLIGDLEKSSYSNIEQQSIDYLMHTIRPWLVRHEQCLRRDLLGPSGRKKHEYKYNFAGLLRGDSSQRKEYYTGLFGIGVLSQNDIRELEDLPPIENGDVYYVAPANSKDPVKSVEENNDGN